MIDEEKLIERIKSQYREWGEDCDAQQTLGDIEDVPKVGEWIPVSERLPEESLDSVLAWDEYRNRCVFAQYYGGHWYLKDEIIKITAWQPVPEPYRGKK